MGEGAGFIEDDGVDLAGGLEEADALDQDAEARGGGQCGDHGGRPGEHEGAGDADDDDRDRALDFSGEEEDEAGEQEHHGGVVGGVLLGQADDRGAGLLGLQDDLAGAADEG